MERAEKLLETASKLIEDGGRPSASLLAEQLDMPEQDVHRCLNYLERENRVETYTRDFLGRRHRMIGVKR